mmetsp:Transcript_25041/g.74721  ORF Transcript_25041/g.74721 Transcript_25041/m.74721 type:complete len:92 (+) Transcript_25041:215-490(+)
MTARGEAGLALNCETGCKAGPGEASALSSNRLQRVSRPDCPLFDPARPKLPFDMCREHREASLWTPPRLIDHLVGVMFLELLPGDRGRSGD